MSYWVMLHNAHSWPNVACSIPFAQVFLYKFDLLAFDHDNQTLNKKTITSDVLVSCQVFACQMNKLCFITGLIARVFLFCSKHYTILFWLPRFSFADRVYIAYGNTRGYVLDNLKVYSVKHSRVVVSGYNHSELLCHVYNHGAFIF